MFARGPAYLRRESDSRDYPRHRESFEGSDDEVQKGDFVTGLRRQKLIILLIILALLAILSLTILALNITIIRALRMNLRGMKALEITKMQVRDPDHPDHFKEEPVVRFMEKADLGHVILDSGKVEGKGDKTLKIDGSRVIFAGNENQTRMVLQEGSCRLDGVENFRVKDFVGKTLFDARNPAVTVDHRIKTIATKYVITNKIRSPVNEDLHFNVDNLIIRGNEGIKSDSKTFNATAGTTLTLKTSRETDNAGRETAAKRGQTMSANRTCEEYRSRFKALTSRRDLGGSSPRKTVEADACWFLLSWVCVIWLLFVVLVI